MTILNEPSHSDNTPIKYMLFMGDYIYPQGGMIDFVGFFTEEEAQELFNKSWCDWAHIWTKETNVIWLEKKDWINNVYTMLTQHKENLALDLIFRSCNDAFEKGHFEYINNGLISIDINRLNITLMIGILTATLPAKHKLRYRRNFYKKVRKVLMSIAPSRVDSLLDGLI